MMPDRFDELARRKKLEQLKPAMGEQTVLDESAPEAMDVPSEVPVEAPTEEAVPQEKEWYQNRQVADALVGATPTLINLLTGASANHTVRGFDQANTYLKNRATQDLPTKDNTFVEDVDGKPVIGMRVDSVGKQAFYQPKTIPGAAAGSKGSAGNFVVYDMFDPATNTSVGVTFSGRDNKWFDNAGSEFTPPPQAIFKKKADKMFSTEDTQGTKKGFVYNEAAPEGKKVKPIHVEPGKGTTYGKNVTKGQADLIETGIKEGQKAGQELTNQAIEINDVVDTMKTSKDARIVASSIYGLVRNVESKGVLTDDDFKNISGEKYESFKTRMKRMIDTQAFGDIEELRKSYVGLAEKIKAKIEQKRDAIPGIYAPNTKQSQDALKSVIPNMNIGKTPEEQYKEIVNRANTVFRDQNKKRMFLDKKRKELGL